MEKSVNVNLDENEVIISCNYSPIFDFSLYKSEKLLSNYIDSLKERLDTIRNCFDNINQNALKTIEEYNNVLNTVKVPEIYDVNINIDSNINSNLNSNLESNINSNVESNVESKVEEKKVDGKKEINKKLAVVDIDRVHLRKDSKVDSDSIGVYRKGSKFELTGNETEDMIEVITIDEKTGWVNKKYLIVNGVPRIESVIENEIMEDTKENRQSNSATVNVDKVYLRSDGNIESTPLAVLDKNTKVYLTGNESEVMIEVKTLDGKTGWIGKKSLIIGGTK